MLLNNTLGFTVNGPKVRHSQRLFASYIVGDQRVSELYWDSLVGYGVFDKRLAKAEPGRDWRFDSFSDQIKPVSLRYFRS
jgi:hypothetical protein